MKKRILIAVLFLMIAFALFACDEHSEPTECEHSWGSWVGTNEGHYHICDKCGAQSKVFNHNCDDAYDIVGGDYIAECKVCKCKVHTPVYAAIEAKSESQNTAYLAEINQAFDALSEIAENGDISAQMSTYLRDGNYYTSLSDLEFSCKNSSELYFELKGKNGAIYHEENGKIYSYTESKKYDYDRKYVCRVDDFLVSSEAFASVDIETGIDLDVSKCNITKESDKYIIEAYATDILGEDVTAMLTEIYKQLDMDSEMLSKITVKIELEFTQTSYNMSTYMSMFVAADGEITEMPFKVYTSIDYSDIEKIDFWSGDYRISPPSCIEEVNTISDATEIFVDDGGYNAVRLEKGQYYALYHRGDVYSMGGRVSVYDDTGEKLEKIAADHDDFYDFNFVIPSDGLYYLVFEGSGYVDVELIRCDYETVYDTNAPKKFDMIVNGVIEGLYDIEYYVFTSENWEPLIVKNTSDIKLYILVDYTEYELKPGEEKRIMFQNGENKISITAQYVTEKVSYSLECTECVNEI